MELLFAILLFVVALAVLIISAKFFTESAERIGLFFGLSPFIIGAVILGVGTSIPELASSIAGALAGKTEIVAANIMGSNIANILLIIGIGALITKQTLVTKKHETDVHFTFFYLSSLFLIIIAIDKVITFFEGMISVLIFVIYTVFVLKNKLEKADVQDPVHWFDPFLLIGSIGLIAYSSHLVIKGLIIISEVTSLGTDVLSASALAIGTSLPELTVSVVALLKGKHVMSIGNIIGSNIFNSTIGIGVPALITALTVSTTTLFVAAPFMFLATIGFGRIIAGEEKSISKYEGVLFVLLFLFFIAQLIS
ncbi:MAG: calcium/sodium antiporter [Candidatus Woesearchaeota archaeon]|nr:MAG: calcium/sodium antiporter [Candidatus Woesearchaeota archaeon]